MARRQDTTTNKGAKDMTTYNPEHELKKALAQQGIISSEELEDALGEALPVGNNIIAYRVANPSEMQQLDAETATKKWFEKTGEKLDFFGGAAYKHMVLTSKWVKDPETKKSKKITELARLDDYTYPPIFPINSPMYWHIMQGDIKCCIVQQRDQDNKIKKGFKEKVFRMFSEAAEAAGYLCIQPDFKRTELRIYYHTPEKLAQFFNITEDRLIASVDKLHKWVKLVDSPTKIEVRDDRMVKFLYHEEAKNELGKDVKDGLGWFNGDFMIMPSGKDKAMWWGFSQFLQIRSYKEAGLLAKCNLCANKKKFRYEAGRMKEIYGVSPTQYELILNQHAVKFDNMQLEAGHIYEVPLKLLIRIINARLKMGSSTLGAQLVAAGDMAAMKFILEEHGLLDSAHRINKLAQGSPEAWIEQAAGFEKVDTNTFLELALLVQTKDGWIWPKIYNIHNRKLSFLESEWRKSIASVSVNTRSAYTYTDDRCDDAMKLWHEKTGEWVSFCTIDSNQEANTKGEVITIKYPLHSKPCIASHRVLTADIFDPESALVVGVEGGIGLSTLYLRSVEGLDEDGDKVALFASEATIKVDLNLSHAPEEEKEEKPKFVTFHDVCEHVREMSEVAAAETTGIGFKDLAVRYALIWLHLHGVEITAEMASLIGAMREGNIKGGVKGAGGLKGIVVASEIDTLKSLTNGTLTEDTINWVAEISGAQIEMISDFKELNKDNLAELVHALVIKGAKTSSNKHSDKFLWRMLTLLPAYMEHKGNKTNVPWHNAFEILYHGIKPEMLEFDKKHHAITQAQYKAVWAFANRHFNEGWGYSFDLENVQGFANWLRTFYKNNRDVILNDYRGIVDPESGQTMKAGDWDAERRARRFQRLNRVIRFLLRGLQPHPADLASLPRPTIVEPAMERSKWFANNNRDTLGFLKFANAYIASIDINPKGKTANSGELTRLFPATPFVQVRMDYYDVTPQGKKEERNPYLDKAMELSLKFDVEWLEKANKWLEKNPYGEEYVYPENDYAGFEEEEAGSEYTDTDED